MNDDQKHRLQEAQRHLADAQRAIDGASVHIRTVLADGRGAGQAPYTPKPDTTGAGNDHRLPPNHSGLGDTGYCREVHDEFPRLAQRKRAGVIPGPHRRVEPAA